MLVPFNEVDTNKTVFVNPKFVVAVFIVNGGPHDGKTSISFTSGNLITDRDQLEVVGTINGHLNA